MAPNTPLWLPASAVRALPASIGAGNTPIPPMAGFGATERPCKFVGTLQMSCVPRTIYHGGTFLSGGAGMRLPQSSMFRFDAVGVDPASTYEKVWYRLAPDSLPLTAGWSSNTGFRPAATPAQKAIRAEVWTWSNSPDGEDSQPSTLASPAGRKRTWDTDLIDNGSRPGDEIIALLQKLPAWYDAITPTKPTASTFLMSSLNVVTSKPPTTQLDELVNCVGYFKRFGDDRRNLVEWVIKQYLCNRSTVALPGASQYEAVLGYLQFKADCRETADRTVISCGGTVPAVDDDHVNSRAVLPIDVRPGMYTYYSHGAAERVRYHTMLVSDTQWDGNGQLVGIEIAESNKGGGWHNPGGMMPWKRRRRRGRVATFNPMSWANYPNQWSVDLKSVSTVDKDHPDYSRYYVFLDSSTG